MPLRRVIFSPEADLDLDGILDYTERTWGYDQAVAYAQSIVESLNWLASYPHAGRTRDELSPRLRSLALDHHIALDRLFDDLVSIRRIIHHREDIQAVVQDSDSESPEEDDEM